MPAWAIMVLVITGGMIADDVSSLWAKKIPKFTPGQQIYVYRNADKNLGEIIQVAARGEGFCRGQLYRKIRLPFQSPYRELQKDGELDACTGQVYRAGKWQNEGLASEVLVIEPH